MKLLAYLLMSYILSYLAHVPVHGSLRNAIIPAALPWAISALVAIWFTKKGVSLRPAWVVLATCCAFFLLGHVVHRG